MITCSNCGNEYKQIGQHWHSSDCDYPSLSERQCQLITGVLMGDGSVVRKKGRKPYFRVTVTEKAFVEWLDAELKPFTSGVSNRTMSSQYKDEYEMFSLTTCSAPAFEQFAHWYDSGEKRYPSNLEITPLIAKMWYVCDGTYFRPDGREPSIRIGCKAQMDRAESVVDLFERVGFSPNWSNHNLVFSIEDTREFLDWIGDPIPPFEYKWGVSA